MEMSESLKALRAVEARLDGIRRELEKFNKAWLDEMLKEHHAGSGAQGEQSTEIIRQVAGVHRNGAHAAIGKVRKVLDELKAKGEENG